MGHPAKEIDAEAFLEELSLLGEAHPDDSKRLVESFQRLWAAPSAPEKVGIIRQIQGILRELGERRLKIDRMKDLLDQYERASSAMEEVQRVLTETGRTIEALEVAVLTARPSNALEELWDNEADAVYDDP